MRVPSIQSLGQARSVLQVLADDVGRLQKWTLVPASGYYNPTPIDTNSFRVADDSLPIWTSGLPIRYRIGGVNYYGMVSNTAAGDGIVKVFGPALTGTIQALWIGDPRLVQQVHWGFEGEYGGISGDLNAAYGRLFGWYGPPAYLVCAVLYHHTGRTGGTKEPTVGIYTTAARAVFAADILMTTSAQVQSTPSASLYRVTWPYYLAARVTDKDDGSPHAKGLSVTLQFVLE